MSSQQSTAEPLPVGTRVGPAILFGQVGRGGVGEVYAAEIDRKRCALKILHPSLVGNAAIKARFEFEYSILARALHPCLPRGLFMDTFNGRPFLVMTWAEGVPLLSWLDGLENPGEEGDARRSPLTWANTRALGRDMLAALAALHREGFVHRDVKADNVMVHTGHAMLIDLGMATKEGSENRSSADWAPTDGLGTPCTWAPERFEGASGDDSRCDLYSAARVLFQCVAGVDAFGLGSPGWQTRVILGVVPPMRAFLAHPCADRFDGFFARALHKHPAQRFPTALAMWRAFAELRAPD